MLKQSKIAVFLFANTPKQESYKKAFSSRQADGFRLAKALVNHARNLLQYSGVDYYVINSTKQQGNTFASRLANAFQTIFDKGYDRVISMGSDCPAITPGLLRKAAYDLIRDEIVLGPSTDGGVYLIGLSKEKFAQINFESIDWKTDQVFIQLNKYVSKEAEKACLPILTDIDSGQDVATVFSKYANQAFIKRLKNIFNAFEAVRFQGKLVIISFPPFSFGLKAPPAFN